MLGAAYRPICLAVRIPPKVKVLDRGDNTSEGDRYATSANANSFAISPLSAQLGDLDDAETPAWDDDIDSTLHQHRAEKHRARMEEHDRRLKEKRGQRTSTGYL
ncbi:unnamed protein product [Nippostrongylus brasiliensis]|uniref:Phosducin domain-containing protein n=1 Tax=Nippostrongylus brasiliensis TaxID=27835 RepID=A0A0N4XZK4_NIPBR|nr:unnamed protein product [Nippostrongylus brasiliensis]